MMVSIPSSLGLKLCIPGFESFITSTRQTIKRCITIYHHQSIKPTRTGFTLQLVRVGASIGCLTEASSPGFGANAGTKHLRSSSARTACSLGWPAVASPGLAPAASRDLQQLDTHRRPSSMHNPCRLQATRVGRRIHLLTLRLSTRGGTHSLFTAERPSPASNSYA